jgi:hypothetical protein
VQAQLSSRGVAAPRRPSLPHYSATLLTHIAGADDDGVDGPDVSDPVHALAAPRHDDRRDHSGSGVHVGGSHPDHVSHPPLDVSHASRRVDHSAQPAHSAAPAAATTATAAGAASATSAAAGAASVAGAAVRATASAAATSASTAATSATAAATSATPSAAKPVAAAVAATAASTWAVTLDDDEGEGDEALPPGVGGSEHEPTTSASNAASSGTAVAEDHAGLPSAATTAAAHVAAPEHVASGVTATVAPVTAPPVATLVPVAIDESGFGTVSVASAPQDEGQSDDGLDEDDDAMMAGGGDDDDGDDDDDDDGLDVDDDLEDSAENPF